MVFAPNSLSNLHHITEAKNFLLIGQFSLVPKRFMEGRDVLTQKSKSELSFDNKPYVLYHCQNLNKSLQRKTCSTKMDLTLISKK